MVIGPSTTQLFRNLSIALHDYITPDSEIIVSKIDHEANIASWVQLAKWRGLTVKWWVPSKDTNSNPKLVPEDLKKLFGRNNQPAEDAAFISIDKLGTDVRVRHGNEYSVKRLGFDFVSFSYTSPCCCTSQPQLARRIDISI